MQVKVRESLIIFQWITFIPLPTFCIYDPPSFSCRNLQILKKSRYRYRFNQVELHRNKNKARPKFSPWKRLRTRKLCTFIYQQLSSHWGTVNSSSQLWPDADRKQWHVSLQKHVHGCGFGFRGGGAGGVGLSLGFSTVGVTKQAICRCHFLLWGFAFINFHLMFFMDQIKNQIINHETHLQLALQKIFSVFF